MAEDGRRGTVESKGGSIAGGVGLVEELAEDLQLLEDLLLEFCRSEASNV